MIEFFSRFLAIGLMYVIVFMVISFLLNAIALKIGGKAAKPETGTWGNAFKASALMFLASLILSALSGYLQTLGFTTQADSMRQVYGGLAALIGLASLAANVYIIMKVFALNGGETVKAILITLVVDFFFHAILIGIFVVLFFGTFFKMATDTLVTPGKGIVVLTEESDKPKLPTLSPSEVVDPSDLGKSISCDSEQDCNQTDELCFRGFCQKADDITSQYGPPCNQPCPNCQSNVQRENYITYKTTDMKTIEATYCVECFLSGMFDCKKGFKCVEEKCVEDSSNQPQNTTSDPESLKRDDQRIGILNLMISIAQASSPSDLASSIERGKEEPCLPAEQFTPPTQTFSVEGKACATAFFQPLKNGFALFVGVENPSKANVDTRTLSGLSSSTTVQDLKPLLRPTGSLPSSTPNENKVFAITFEQSSPANPVLSNGSDASSRSKSTSTIADLSNISQGLEVYYGEFGEYPAGKGCLSENGSGKAVYTNIKDYFRNSAVPQPIDLNLKSLDCVGTYYYQSFESNGKANGAYVLAGDLPTWQLANFELPASLDASLFTGYDAIDSKKGTLTQESDNPLRSIYVLIP